MYKKYGDRQSKQQSYPPKRNILLESPLKNPTQALAVMSLSSPGNALSYNVVKKRKLSFPKDHIRHPGVISDWYYLVGQLQNKKGDKYAFVSVFQAFYIMGPDLLQHGENIENVHIEQIVWMFTSEPDQTTSVAPLVALPAKEMVLPTLKKFEVKLPNYSLVGTGPNPFPMTITMKDPKLGTKMTLTAKAVKPMLLQGDHGYVGMAGLGEGWLYYSYPKLQLDGQIHYKGENMSVSGIGWFDHQWGTTGTIKNPVIRYFIDIMSVFSKPPTFAGWNWFSVQVETKDKKAIEFTGAYGNMYKDGKVDIVSTPHKAGYGNLSFPDGSNRKVKGDIFITTLAYTHSPATHFKYPIKWLIQIPKEDFEVVLDAISPHQFAFWVDGTEWAENACSAVGTFKGENVQGIGWGECIGYEDQNYTNTARLQKSGIKVTPEKLTILRESTAKVSRKYGTRNLFIIILSLIVLTLLIVLILVTIVKKSNAKANIILALSLILVVLLIVNLSFIK